MLDRLTGLQVFARAAALGSLSAAARAMGMSQTMATKHVNALEERLGVHLLHRTTRRTSLTEAGRRYLDSAERILADLAEADAMAAAEQLEVNGILRINAPVSFGARVLSPLLPAFAARHPGLRVELGVNDRLVDLVEEGWDVAIRIGPLRDEALVARRLAPCRLALAAAPAYLETHGTPRTVEELSSHNCLAYTLSRTLGPDHWRFGKTGAVRVAISGNLQASNGDTLVAAALGGQGIVYEPTFILGDDLRSGALVAIELDHPPIELDGVFAIYPGHRRPPAKVRAFVDHLVERLRPAPPWDRGLRVAN
ncbi:LysR family transcriptional regulator [Aureimonas mangrovi]|uniref:LysR family transcriptional regulator n=1 Tax=Aureimonas mangrovi TaxID=2758041 RepID=UPI00163DD6CD|nr:LysR family transcriptional regulator [Aureimonas mangrovi]